MMLLGLFFAQAAYLATAATAEITLGRPLTSEEDGAIWVEVFGDAKVVMKNAAANAPARR